MQRDAANPASFELQEQHGDTARWYRRIRHVEVAAVAYDQCRSSARVVGAVRYQTRVPALVGEVEASTRRLEVNNNRSRVCWYAFRGSKLEADWDADWQ
jgi:hypothetical protein